MRSLEHSGWFLVNIAVPLLAPLALLPLAKLPNFFREHSRGVLRRAIEHGQLLWAALPMSASACYMLSGVVGGSGPHRHHLAAAYLGAHICVIALSAAGIVLGTMESCLAASGAPRITSGILRYSLVLTAITAALHFLAYLHVVQPATT